MFWVSEEVLEPEQEIEVVQSSKTVHFPSSINETVKCSMHTPSLLRYIHSFSLLRYTFYLIVCLICVIDFLLLVNYRVEIII